MSLRRAKLGLLLITSVIGLASGGCMSPWSTPFGRNEKTPTPNEINNATAAATRLPTTSNRDDPNADFAAVLDKIEEVRALDPSAEPKLMEELHRTPPNTWPLVAEQFRATLAYHQQLMAQEQAASPTANASASWKDTLAATASTSNPGSRVQPPSSQIGALLDPKMANKETSGILAQAASATPPARGVATTGGTPAEFAEGDPARPIKQSNTVTIKQAGFQTPIDADHATAQSGAKDGSNNTRPPDEKPSASDSLTEEDWQKLVQRAADDLSRHVAASPATTAEIHQHVSLRMLRLLQGDTEKALEPIPHITPAEQDYWSRQMFALATYLDHHSQPDDKRRAAATVVHLDEAVSNLRELGSLSVRNLSFCKNVYGYGAYEPYEADIFSSGQQLSLYVEIENYHSVSNEKGYCTLLGASYEILDDKGKRVSGGEFPDVDDCCKSRRRDFHIQFGLTLPENLTTGRYRLELVVKDRQSDKLGHATAPFEVRAGRK
jgi:hypothetical protein